MADDWWSNLLEIMFGSEKTGHIGVSNAWLPGMASTGKNVADEVAKQEQAYREQAQPVPSPSPSPSPTAKATTTAKAPPKNPNARDDETAQQRALTSADAVKVNSDLYGTLPTGKVYVGTKNVQRGQNWGRAPKLEDIAEVTAQINTWGAKKLEKFSNLAVDAGLLREPTKNLDALESVWQALAIRSAKMWERGMTVTPWQLLQRYGKDGTDATKAALGPVTTTSISKSTNLSSPRDANTLVDAALAQRLGRSATKDEKKKFLEALNSAEKKEPTTTKTTTTVSGSGTENISQSSNTETSGGVNATSFAEEWSMGHNKEEAGSYQALSTYMPAFYAALGAPV
jgi:hypothetical protein